MKTMKQLFLILLSVFLLTSCDPQPQNTADFKAVFTFTTARHTIDVHCSMTAIYYGTPAPVQLDVVHIMPMQSNHAYTETVELNNVDMDQLHFLTVQVQQGYVVQDTAFNMFKVKLYKDNVFIWEGHNEPTDDNTFHPTVITQ